MPLERLRRFGRRIGLGVGLLSMATHTQELKRPIPIVEQEERAGAFSFKQLHETERSLYSQEKHKKSAQFYDNLLGKMFKKIKVHYKHPIRNIKELTPILNSLYEILDKELPMIKRGEKTVVTFNEAFERKKRDCDIGAYLILEVLRSMNLKGVNFFYGHRYTHGYIGIEIDGKRYRFETTLGKFLTILDEDIFIPIKDAKKVFDYRVYYHALFYSNPELAKQELKRIMERDHFYDSEFSYAELIMEKDPVLGRMLFKSAFEKTNYGYVYGIGWAYYELRTGNTSGIVEILDKVRIPDKIDFDGSVIAQNRLKLMRGYIQLNYITNPEKRTALSNAIDNLSKKIDSAQKVY